MVEQEDKTGNSFVNAAQGIVGAVVLAVLMWVGNSVQEQSVTVVKIESEIALMRQTVDNLEGRLSDIMNSRYTIQDAEEDQRYLNLQLQILEGRINSLENQDGK